jgi:hypothetical protein
MHEYLSNEQFYNCSETNLGFKLLPLETSASRKEKSAANYKRNRRLMTILACCMASSNNNLISFVKSSKTETFRKKGHIFSIIMHPLILIIRKRILQNTVIFIQTNNTFLNQPVDQEVNEQCRTKTVANFFILLQK